MTVLTKSQVQPQKLLMAWVTSRLPSPFLSLERQISVSVAARTRVVASRARRVVRRRRRMVVELY
jgi:hypothetical protein